MIHNHKKHPGETLYRCPSAGEQNNGLVGHCEFEEYFESTREYAYRCPICNDLLEAVPDGPTVSELLQKGQRDEDKR